MQDEKLRVTRMCRSVAIVWSLLFITYVVLSILMAPRAARPGELLTVSPLLQTLSVVLFVGLMSTTILLARVVRRWWQLRS
jgi:hypothetical protein